MNNKINATILGTGSFGTAFACAIVKENLNVTLWGNSEEILDEIKNKRTNKNYLKNIVVPQEIQVAYSLKEALQSTDIVFFVVPSQAVKEVARNIKPYINSQTFLVNLSKGMDLSQNKRLSQVIKEFFPTNPLVIISGPSHAEELALKFPTSVVAASRKMGAAHFIQETISNDYFRVYTSNDVIGVEYGGILKNIIALAAGISDGLGFGSNTKALLLTRGLVEMARFGHYFGANISTFHGLSGMGDLIVTATSVLSRNWNFGNKLGKGLSFESALKEMSMVVEGINATKATYELAQQHHIQMPLTSAIYDVLYNQRSPKEVVVELMTRQMKSEI
jgi:glycerol-3-phosphate dehydrogenase (NAD(P)+)